MILPIYHSWKKKKKDGDDEVSSFQKEDLQEERDRITKIFKAVKTTLYYNGRYMSLYLLKTH